MTTYLMGWNDTLCPDTTRTWLAPEVDPTGIYYVAGGGEPRCGGATGLFTGGFVIQALPTSTGAGTGELDFGAYPGDGYATLLVTGQTGLLSFGQVRAMIHPVDTVDHTADEHRVVEMVVTASAIVPGVGFTIAGYIGGGGKTTGLWSVQWNWSN